MMKIIYILWTINPDPALHARGVWFDNIISCELAAMEAAADTGLNLKQFSCVPLDVTGVEA